MIQEMEERQTSASDKATKAQDKKSIEPSVPEYLQEADLKLFLVDSFILYIIYHKYLFSNNLGRELFLNRPSEILMYVS